MRDLAPDPQLSDIDLVGEPACCPGGACGPIFETPLLELAFNRLRDSVRSRNAATLAEASRRIHSSTGSCPPRLPRQLDHLASRRMLHD